jgi:hypothetical protein
MKHIGKSRVFFGFTELYCEQEERDTYDGRRKRNKKSGAVCRTNFPGA